MEGFYSMCKEFIGIIVIEAYADDEMEVHLEIDDLFEKSNLRLEETIVCEKTPFYKVKYSG